MPRPSDRPPGAVWRLLEAWSAAHPLHPNQRQMAGLFDVSDSLLTNWKYADSLMQTDDIALVAEKTGVSFEEVARAAAEDAPQARQAASARTMKSSGRAIRRRQDEEAEVSQDRPMSHGSQEFDPREQRQLDTDRQRSDGGAG